MKLLITSCLLFSLMLGINTVYAQPAGLHLHATSMKAPKQDRNSDKRQKQKSGKSISESQAASIARSKTGGKVLKVSRLGKNGGYRVKLLLSSGRVTQVTVSASGRVSGH